MRRLAPFTFSAATRSLPALLLLALLLLVACEKDGDAPPATLPPLEVTTYKNEAAFDLLYPADWSYQVMREGIMLFGEEEVLFQQEAGASVVFYRIPANTGREDLPESFAHFMDNGPLRTGYEETSELQSVQLDGREALAVSVKRDEAETQPAVQAYILGTRTESGSIYIISATAPSDEWNRHWPAFQVLVQSIHFNE
jgi:hypothetical protein